VLGAGAVLWARARRREPPPPPPLTPEEQARAGKLLGEGA
jgi:hypothetical protein